MRQLIFTTLFFLFSFSVFSGPNGKFIYHTVEKGETLYSISHQYGLKPLDVAQYNDGIGDKLTIRIGQKIKIPSSDGDASVADNAVPTVAAHASEQYHVVSKGETIFSISKQYNVSRDDLMSWNRIRDNAIAVGQKLVIKVASIATATTTEKPESAPQNSNPAKNEMQKAMKKDGYLWTVPSENTKTAKTNVSTATADATASSAPSGLADGRIVKSWKAESATERHEYFNSKTNVIDPASEYESLYYQSVYSGMTKKSETGVAKFTVDNNTANTAYYNNAPVGTILKLTNADNGKSTYAIVVGKIPTAEQNSYLMKLSNKVARNLSAKDYSSIEIVCYTEN